MDLANSTSTDLVKRFGAADYVVFFLSLALSAAIGIYFGCTGKRQSTTKEFLFADRSMSIVPVAMSLFASFVSAITIIGMPAEIYTYGYMYAWIIVSYAPSVLLSAFVYMPVFYELDITSLYEYLEMRFNRATRVIAAFCFILQSILYMAVVVYGPSLAISTVTGLNTWLSVIAISLVCIFYTSLGGMKAVLWTDTLQATIMFIGVLAVLIQGFLVTGWDNVWRDASESGRLHTNYDPNPLERNTVWSLAIGGTFYFTAIYCTNQTQFQRALTMPSLRSVKVSLLMNIPLLLIIVALSCASGLIMYSYYKLCDPLTSGAITAMDQLHPLFVMDALGHLSGLPGLIVAAIASASLSTVSSGLNSLSAVILIDIVTPLKKQPMSEKYAAIFTRVIAVVLGLVVIGFTFIIANMTGIIQTATTLVSVCSGPVLGVFTLGLFFPCANGKGAVAGILSALAVVGWLAFGASFNPPYFYKFPTSIEGCPLEQTTMFSTSNSSVYNVTLDYVTSTQPLTTKSVEELIAESRTGIRAVYSISYWWNTMIAVFVCNIVGLFLSFITGRQDPATVDPRLISPISDTMCCCLPSNIRKYLYCGVDHNKQTDGNSVEEDQRDEEDKF